MKHTTDNKSRFVYLEIWIHDKKMYFVPQAVSNGRVSFYPFPLEMSHCSLTIKLTTLGRRLGLVMPIKSDLIFVTQVCALIKLCWIDSTNNSSHKLDR